MLTTILMDGQAEHQQDQRYRFAISLQPVPALVSLLATPDNKAYLCKLHLCHDASPVCVGEGLLQGVQGGHTVAAPVAHHPHLAHLQAGHGSTDQGDGLQGKGPAPILCHGP